MKDFNEFNSEFEFTEYLRYEHGFEEPDEGYLPLTSLSGLFEDQDDLSRELEESAAFTGSLNSMTREEAEAVAATIVEGAFLTARQIDALFVLGR